MRVSQEIQKEAQRRKRERSITSLVSPEILKARSNMLSFTEYTFNNNILLGAEKYLINWHHRNLCDKLDRFARGEIKRLMVFMPPQHGKSELCSRRFPAYMFGLNPNIKIIAASNSPSLAQDFNRDIQRIMDTEAYKELFPNTYLSGSNVRYNSLNSYVRTTNKFEIVNFNGSYRCAGTGHNIVGNPATMLLIDDPLKGAEASHSTVVRNKLWDWYNNDFKSRRSNQDVPILLIQTRWNEDDLAGRLLKLERDKWEVVEFPAICEHEDNLDDPRKIGEALWKDRFGLQALQEIKDTGTEENPTGGEYWFSALYQQNPKPLGGNQFKKADFRYYSVTHNGQALYTLRNGEVTKNVDHSKLTIFCTMDLAMTLTSKSDFTVICTWGLTQDNDLILLDMFRSRMEGAEHIDLVWNVYNKWKPQVIYIESVQYQVALVQMATKQGLPAKELKAGKQDTRYLSILAKFEQHKVFLPQSSYLIDIEDELLAYPNGAHDDIVTCFSYAGIQIGNIASLILGRNPSRIKPQTHKNSLNKLLKNYY